MSDDQAPLPGPDLAKGIALSSVADGSLIAGHVDGEAVLLARRGDELFAIGATCTHQGAPLADGLMVGDTVRCPWHHACFSLRTGEALRAPALDAVSRWRVEQSGDTVRVRGKLASEPRAPGRPGAATPGRVVIVGGGAAGNAAAETLRREGFAGRLTILSADDEPPCDRPSLSKGYLAGAAPAEAIPLRPESFYREHGIQIALGSRVVSLDVAGGSVQLEDGSRHAYDALLLATGAEPVRLAIPGAGLPHVHYLRTAGDARALAAAAAGARRAVVIGASFIGLEVASSLRARNVDVHVVSPDRRPMERVLGAEVGDFVRRLHEEHGVSFHLGTTAAAIGPDEVTLANAERLAADLVVVGIGVRPAIALAERAGLAVDRGVLVDERLETSAPGVFAAGDIARWPDRLTGERLRIEHWVVAERQGQTAARNMLGAHERFDAVPFFWTDQYDFNLAYVGHAERWDEAAIEGRLDERDCAIRYRLDGRTLAMAFVHRDLDALRAELELERAMAAKG